MVNQGGHLHREVSEILESLGMRFWGKVVVKGREILGAAWGGGTYKLMEGHEHPPPWPPVGAWREAEAGAGSREAEGESWDPATWPGFVTPPATH